HRRARAAPSHALRRGRRAPSRGATGQGPARGAGTNGPCRRAQLTLVELGRADTSAPRALGVVKAALRTLDQPVSALPVCAACRGSPGATGAAVPPDRRTIGLAIATPNPLARPPPTSDAGVRHEDDKPLTAVPGDQIDPPDVGVQLRGDPLQASITLAVAEAV